MATVSSLLLVFFSYLLNNSPLFTGENLPCFALAEWTRSHFVQETEEENVVYINTAYDRQLVPYREDGFEMGNTDITDRHKLLQLLQLLQQTNYRYIFMDIRFEQGCESEDPAIDSLLFAQIDSMPHIVLVQHRDVQNMAGVPTRKMAYNDYYATITATNFVRYQFLMGDRQTMPLYAFREMTGDSIKRHMGLFYTSAGHLCYNSLFLTFSPQEQATGSLNLMGRYILQDEKPLTRLSQMVDGKLVVIGDLTHDLHDTYSGMHAGGEMLASAVRALLDHRHLVNGWRAFFLFCLYLVLSLVMFTPKRWYEYIPLLQRIQFPVLGFVLSFIGYSTVLMGISFFLGLFFRTYVTFLLPSLWFSFFSSYVSFKKENKQK